MEWEDRKYVDLWSVPHVLAGATLGALSSLVDEDWLVGPSLLALSGWEVFEIARDAHEPPTNRVMDVVVGAAGWAAAYPLKRLPKRYRALGAGIIGAAWLGFALYGHKQVPEATPV